MIIPVQSRSYYDTKFPEYTCTVTRDRLEKIAALFDIAQKKVERLDDRQLQDTCFKKVLNDCARDDWTRIHAARELVFGLTNSEGKSVREVLTCREHALPNCLEMPPENLVLRGGGPKGLAYIGVVEALEGLGMLDGIKRFAGTSAGAITATLLALGYRADELKIFLTAQSLITLLVDPPTFSGGVCKGESFRRWMAEAIGTKTGDPNLTFGELHDKIKEGLPFKHLHIMATRIGSNKEIVHFSSEDKRWSDLIIADAVRASMSLPILFRPHTLHVKGASGARVPRKDGGSFIDGGLIANFPLEIFDKKRYVEKTLFSKEEGECPVTNKRTLGCSLYTPGDPIQKSVETVTWAASVGRDCLGVWEDAEQLIRKNIAYNRHRTIQISNVGVDTFSFGLDETKMHELIASGRAAAHAFFQEQHDRAMRLQAFDQGVESTHFPIGDRKECYLAFQMHDGRVLRVEILGEKITFHTEGLPCFRSAVGTPTPFSLENLAKGDPRFQIFAAIDEDDMTRAHELFCAHASFYKNCFRWDLFITLVIEEDAPKYIDFFLGKGLSFNGRWLRPLWHAYTCHALDAFRALLRDPEIDLMAREVGTNRPLFSPLLAFESPGLTRAYRRALKKRFPDRYQEIFRSERYITEQDAEKVLTRQSRACADANGNTFGTVSCAVFSITATLPLLGAPGIYCFHLKLRNFVEAMSFGFATVEAAHSVPTGDAVASKG